MSQKGKLPGNDNSGYAALTTDMDLWGGSPTSITFSFMALLQGDKDVGVGLGDSCVLFTAT